jgi:hypothetical protein
VSFENNEASIGRDMFIYCYDIESMINEEKIRYDMRIGVYNRENVLFGRDKVKYELDDVNLIDFVLIYQYNDIFISSDYDENQPKKQCGSKNHLCRTLSEGREHMEKDYENKYLIIREIRVERGIEMEDVIMKTLEKNKVNVVLMGDVIVESEGDGIFECLKNVFIEKILFFFISFFLSSKLNDILRKNSNIAQSVGEMKWKKK